MAGAISILKISEYRRRTPGYRKIHGGRVAAWGIVKAAGHKKGHERRSILHLWKT